MEVKTKFSIPSINVSLFLKRFAKVVKAAAKLGLEAPVAKEIGEEFVAVYEEHAFGQVKAKRRHVLFEVTGTAPKLEGWTFMATIEPTTAGNRVRALPGMEVATSWQHAQMSCDHCKKDRKRSEYFLVAKGEEVRSVGRQCIRDFLGHQNPAHIAAMMEYIRELKDSEDEDRSGGGYGELTWEVKDIVRTTMEVIALSGFVPKSAMSETAVPTSGIVMDLLTPPYSDSDRARLRKLEEKYSGRLDEAKMAEIITILNGYADKLSPSNFEHNISICMQLGYVSHKEMGLMVAGVAIAARSIDAAIAARFARADKPNEWVGTVGDRGEYELTCTGTRPIESDFGISTLLTFEDISGNVFKWFASGEKSEFEVGEKYLLKGTIKRHEDYKGVKQTTLSRCKIVKQLGVAA